MGEKQKKWSVKGPWLNVYRMRDPRYGLCVTFSVVPGYEDFFEYIRRESVTLWKVKGFDITCRLEQVISFEDDTESGGSPKPIPSWLHGPLWEAIEALVEKYRPRVKKRVKR